MRPSRTFSSAACIESCTWRNGSATFLASASKRGRAWAGWSSSASAEAICSWTRGSSGNRASRPSPDGQGLVVLLGALIDPAQRLEDLHEVVARGLALQGALEGVGGLLGLADQDEGLAEIVGGQGVVGSMGLGLAERGDGGGVLPALEFEEAEDQPGGAVLGVLGDAVAVGLDEGVERAAFDVVSVDAVQRRAAPGVLSRAARGSVAWRAVRGPPRRRPDHGLDRAPEPLRESRGRASARGGSDKPRAGPADRRCLVMIPSSKTLAAGCERSVSQHL